MFRYWKLELLAFTAGLFGFGANAKLFHDLARLSLYWGPVADLLDILFS